MTHFRRHTLLGDAKEIKKLMALQAANRERHTMTHTPGPWTIEKTNDHDASYRVMDEQEVTIALCYQQPGDTWKAKDNAHLIAAAPALYEALKAMYAVWGYKSDGHTPELSDQVEAALALVE